MRPPACAIEQSLPSVRHVTVALYGDGRLAEGKTCSGIRLLSDNDARKETQPDECSEPPFRDISHCSPKAAGRRRARKHIDISELSFSANAPYTTG